MVRAVWPYHELGVPPPQEPAVKIDGEFASAARALAIESLSPQTAALGTDCSCPMCRELSCFWIAATSTIAWQMRTFRGLDTELIPRATQETSLQSLLLLGGELFGLHRNGLLGVVDLDG